MTKDPTPSRLPLRVDITENDTKLIVGSDTYTRFRVHFDPGKAGVRRCGLWIEGERQYAVAVYRDDEWMFTVPDSVELADMVYDQIARDTGRSG